MSAVGVLHVLGLVTTWVTFAAWAATAHAQAQAQDSTDTFAIPDTIYAAQPPSQPITYLTTYDLDVSRSTWMQSLSYSHSGRKFSLNANGTTNVLTPIRGLETEGKDGSFTGNLGFRATNRWLWNLDGLFDMSSNEDSRSSTKRRQNKVQARTQYSATFLPGLSGTGLAYTELRTEQILSRKAPLGGLSLDSTYTSGRRDGVSGTLKWTPAPWLDVTGLGSGNWNHLTTKSRQQTFGSAAPDSGSSDEFTTFEIPTGDERFETSAFYRGIPKTVLGANLRSKSGSQTMWAVARGRLDALSWYDRSANLKVEHTPMPGGGLVLEGTFSQVYRDYRIQDNLNTLGRTYSGSTNFFFFRPGSRVMAGFQLSRVQNQFQRFQNGTIVNRAMNLSGAQRINDRLWLDGSGTLSLFSRKYENPVEDQDDLRGYANVGGGYRVSSRCSTSVHFSVTRAHTVAIDAEAAAENNVQTSYQMDASLRLRMGRTLHLLQNYQINANYFIYDFEFQEDGNSLTRIRRIDTVLSDSLFDFAILRLTHNFLASDRGVYMRTEEGGPRKYGVARDEYVQNLSVTVGIRPLAGVVLMATQSLGNTRTYFYAPRFPSTNLNRWNLNLSAQVDRTLPGDLNLQGSIQHIGEYAEVEGNLLSRNEKDYWLAGASLQKNF